MTGVTVLNVHLTEDYLKEIAKHLSASVVPYSYDTFKFKSALDGAIYLHPMLNDVFFSEHCLLRYEQRKHKEPKSGLLDILERAFPDRHISSGRKSLDDLTHQFIISVLNSNLEYAEAKEDALSIRIEKREKIVVLKKGPFYLFKTFMEVPPQSELGWNPIPVVLDPYKALQRIFQK